MKAATKQQRVPRHVWAVNEAVKKITRQLDEFEMACVKNGIRIRKVVFTNSPKTEFSQVDFKWGKPL